MKYLGYGELDGVPNVIVDGSAQADTVLTLSHWPNSPTPVDLQDDLSAQITFHYLDHPELHVAAEVVSNNHFDQDGFMSVFALVDPEGAQARRARAIDVARAGDFGTFEDRESVRIAWTVASLEAELAEDEDPYAVLLDRAPDLLDHPDEYREHWAEEDEHLETSESAIWAGEVRLEEIEDLDLAIVSVPDEWPIRPVRRFTRSGLVAAVHPSAVNNATDRFRILTVHGGTYTLEYRYETWVRYLARRPLGRIDLTALATELSALEPGSAHWTFDGVGDIVPMLHLTGAETGADESAITPAEFCDRVIQALTTGVSAWNPYD